MCSYANGSVTYPINSYSKTSFVEGFENTNFAYDYNIIDGLY